MYICIPSLIYMILITLHKRELQHPLCKPPSQQPPFCGFHSLILFLFACGFISYIWHDFRVFFFFNLMGFGVFFWHFQWISCFITCWKLVEFFFLCKVLKLFEKCENFIMESCVELKIKDLLGVFKFKNWIYRKDICLKDILGSLINTFSFLNFA